MWRWPCGDGKVMEINVHNLYVGINSLRMGQDKQVMTHDQCPK